MDRIEERDVILDMADDAGVKGLVERNMKLEEENRKLQNQVNALLFTVKMQEALIREIREKKSLN